LPYRLLLIENDPVDQLAFKRLMETEQPKYDYRIADSVAQTKEILGSEKFDIVIADYMLGDGTAFDILDLLKDTPIIFASGSGNEEIAVKAMKAGAYDYLIKDHERNYLKVLPLTVDNGIMRKIAEEKLAQAAAEWRTTFDSISDFVTIHDTDYRIVRANRALADFLKVEPKDIIGKKCYQLFHGLSEPCATCPHRRTLETRQPCTSDFFEPHLGIHMEVFTSPIFDNKGELTGSAHITRDITERKQTEEEIRNLAKFPGENPNPVLRVSDEGCILYSNKACRPLLEQWQSWEGDLLPGQWRQFVLDVANSGRFRQADVELDERIFSLTFAPVEDCNYVNVYALDITERKQAEEKLKEHDRLKTEFIVNVSHELRTPLTIFKNIISNLQAGVVGKMNDKQHKNLEIADKEIDRLARIISDFMDVAKIEAGEINLDLQLLSVQSLVTDVVELLKPLADEKNTELITSMGEVDLFVNVDRDRMIQVLTNLINNAIKFVPDIGGRIVVQVKDVGDEISIAVEDNGRGINADDISKVFDRFVQVEKHVGPGYHGTGLGLSISRELIELHGGRIWAESESGHGSKFCFTVPKCRQEQPAARQQEGLEQGEPVMRMLTQSLRVS